MFRIARIRIRWINTHQHNANIVLQTQPARAAVVNTSLRRPWALNPRNWRVRVSWVGFGSTNSATVTAPTAERLGGQTTLSALPQVFQRFDPRKLRVRVKWIGFGSMDSTLPTASTPVPMTERITIPSPGRVLQTFDLQKMRVRVSWIGLGSTHRIGTWALVLFTLLLGIFAFMRLAHGNDTNRALDTEKVVPAGLIADEVSLGNETIRMVHSPLDIGQPKDIFDNDLDTLMRGLNANPFILDLQFSQPQAIQGLVMDFGRMDFVMRVQVYGTNNTKPISYRGEYPQQPPIPHVDMDFVSGPEQVSRIYIEIEQLNPPEEIHIHIREVLFKE